MSVIISAIETFAVCHPVRGRFKFFENPAGKPTGRLGVVIKITASDGTTGWGFSGPSPRWSYETLESVQSTIEQYLRPELIDKDPFDFEACARAMSLAIAPSFSTGQPICKAGVDLALFDLTGRLASQSAADRWRRQVEQPIPLSWTLNPRSLEEAEQQLAEAHTSGYRHFNVKVAPDLKFDLAVCRLIKQHAPDCVLWADANGGYDEVTALAAAPRLADIGVDFFEQPTPANRLAAYRRLHDLRALPIIMDEGLVSVTELQEFHRLNLLDGVAIKIQRCGGISEARRQVEFAQANGLIVLGSGLTDPDLSLAASLLLYSAYELKHPAALNGPQFLEGSILKEPILSVAGMVTPPQGAGLGVQVDETRLGKLRIDERAGGSWAELEPSNAEPSSTP